MDNLFDTDKHAQVCATDMFNENPLLKEKIKTLTVNKKTAEEAQARFKEIGGSWVNKDESEHKDNIYEALHDLGIERFIEVMFEQACSGYIMGLEGLGDEVEYNELHNTYINNNMTEKYIARTYNYEFLRKLLKIRE